MRARRRGHHEGSIGQRSDGRWQGRISLPDGRRKYVYAPTKKEVVEKMDAAKRQLADGLGSLDERQTLEQYLARWLVDSAKPSLQPKTWASYESIVRIRVNPRIGHVKLGRVTPQHLQTLYADLLGTGLTLRSVQFTHAVLHRALKQALRWGLVARNPADAVTAPRPRRKEFHALTQGEVDTLLGAVEGTERYLLYVLAVTTGLRQGELLALKWADIDMEGGKLAVQRRLERRSIRDGHVFADAKKGRSRRSVALARLAIEALRSSRAHQAEARLRAGPAWEDYDLVLTNDLGEPLAPRSVTRRLHADLEFAGLPRVRFHDLRHTAATLLLADGTHPKIVQELMGHATIAVTMDTYSHVLPHMQREAAGTFDRLLRPARGG